MPVWASQAYKPEKSTKAVARRAWQWAELPQLPPRCAGGQDGAGEDDQGVVSLLGLILKSCK